MPTEQFTSLPKENQKLIKRYNKEDIQNVENQKNWLDNWYTTRLPILGKEQLKSFVKEGLKTPYHLPWRQMFHSDYPERVPGTLGYYQASNNPHIVLETTQDSTPVHEFNHAIQYQGGQYDFTDQFTGEESHKNKVNNSDIPYLESPDEQHSRIMEIRYINNLDPRKTDYTLEDVKNLQKGSGWTKFDELHKGGMSDEDIQRALNTWASNSMKSNDLFSKNNGTYLAQFGGRLHYFDYFK